MHDMQELVPALDLAATNKAHYPNESVEYRAARNALIVEEIELRRHLERVASQRRAMPSGGEIPQDFLLVLVDAGKGGRAGGMARAECRWAEYRNYLGLAYTMLSRSLLDPGWLQEPLRNCMTEENQYPRK